MEEWKNRRDKRQKTSSKMEEVLPYRYTGNVNGLKLQLEGRDEQNGF